MTEGFSGPEVKLELRLRWRQAALRLFVSNPCKWRSDSGSNLIQPFVGLQGPRSYKFL